MSRFLFAIVSLALLARPALGHSSLERSEPKNGDVLQVAPREIRMWFTEPIKVALSTFEVRNRAGKQIDQRDLRADEKLPALVRLSLSASLARASDDVTHTRARLLALSPASTLRRGYAIVQHPNDGVVRSAAEVKSRSPCALRKCTSIFSSVRCTPGSW